MRAERKARSRRCDRLSGILFLAVVAGFAACSPEEPRKVASSEAPKPSILFVTLDTTRADRLGLESSEFETPHLDALAARGLYFSHAYSTAPMTLPAHASMFTGQYPADHGVHENGRYVPEDRPLLAERLQERGYTTAAFVSGYPLSREFGLSRGFDHFDDEFGESEVERDAASTTDRALAYLERGNAEPVFLWVHYFDPHEPYDPPEPFRSRYETDLYQGEIAFMDRELGRLMAGFEARTSGGGSRFIVVADHGEGLGDHGEALHGNLLYQGVMRVPLVVAGSGISSGRMDEPVSIRQAFETVLGWADANPSAGWLSGNREPVLAEALKPYLQYGWQPQIMGVSGTVKVIRSGETEIYDIEADPEESRNLVGEIEVQPPLVRALRDYAVHPVAGGAERESLSQETIEKLASLGYFDSGQERGPRKDAPSPKEMTRIFRDLDVGSALFVRGEYARAIPVYGRVLEADPENLMVCLRLAVAHSVLGYEKEAEAFFERARSIDPESIDLRHYHGMHYFRFGQWKRAAPLLESVLAQMPRRLPALECMAQIRQREGKLAEARRLLERVVALKDAPVAELLRLGELGMALQDTPGAISAFERAREIQQGEFQHFLELGVCYLANRQLPEAAASLDRVPRLHPGYPMALFKRAQVAVLMNESDWRERVRRAQEYSDETTRQLIDREPLFRGFTGR
jgi:arylsulfatase A-like enzyme/Tfp pilus assembly protein PilF